LANNINNTRNANNTKLMTNDGVSHTGG